LGDDVERRLGAADHHDTFAHERIGIPIVPRVHDGAPKLAWQLRDGRIPVMAGRNHDPVEAAGLGLSDYLPASLDRLDSLYGGAEVDMAGEIVLGRVRRE